MAEKVWHFKKNYPDVHIELYDVEENKLFGIVDANKFVLAQCQYFERAFDSNHQNFFGAENNSVKCYVRLDKFDTATVRRFFVLLYHCLSLKFDMTQAAEDKLESVRDFIFRHVALTVGSDPMHWVQMSHCAAWFCHLELQNYMEWCLSNNNWRVEDRVSLCEYFLQDEDQWECFVAQAFLLVNALGNPSFLHTSLIQMPKKESFSYAQLIMTHVSSTCSECADENCARHKAAAEEIVRQRMNSGHNVDCFQRYECSTWNERKKVYKRAESTVTEQGRVVLSASERPTQNDDTQQDETLQNLRQTKSFLWPFVEEKEESKEKIVHD